ncbi:hypothetical protein BDA99DRAFT_156861 [Phascolomyces articulosus]|uniref:Heterokaryon incompatibility domain-containing protein n=1 Tax=Phascolomyces articulosus TaxID=60185 RepID=A0AAD5JUS2_9FUNG|nr:hypothetical protein BDA99DRAFT_156861 [Phascolomyces articulosus]
MYITYDTKQYPIFADSDIALYGDQKKSKLQALERSNERPPPGIRHLMSLPSCNNKKQSPFWSPAHLVRVSDMTIVPGTEASKHGYCALSYAWNWSGDIVVRGKENSIRVDKGMHKLVFHRQPTCSAPTCTENTSPSEQGQTNDSNTISSSAPNTMIADSTDSQQQQQEDNNDDTTISFVKFEDLIQQICKDFNIQYIWYDQLCINNKKSKYSSGGRGDINQDAEMQQMHKYYNNAQYTVVLVPEMKVVRKIPLTATTATDSTYYPVGHHNISRCIRAIHESQWSMRTWTYQEALSSKRLLFLGENTHLWSDSVRHIYYSQFSIATASTRIAAYYIKSLCEKQHENNNNTRNAETQTQASMLPPASLILRHFHTRRSTKEHDRLFALANIFYNMNVHITSKEPVLAQMVDLYGKIANQDLTILCFGKPTKTSFNSMQQHYYNLLPSWTGVTGYHIYAKKSSSNVTPSITTANRHSDMAQRKIEMLTAAATTTRSNNKNKNQANNGSTIHLQKFVRKVLFTLAFSNRKSKTVPKQTDLMAAENERFLVNARNNYTVRDASIYIFCESIQVLVEPFDWDDGRLGRFSTDQIFSYQTLPMMSAELKGVCSVNKSSSSNNFFSSTRLWMDSRDIIVLKEATGLQITHTLLLNSLISETSLMATHKESLVSSICFSLTTTDRSRKCVVLSGVSFDVQHCSKRFKAFPVIQQCSTDANCYKSIGLCFVRSTFKQFNSSSRYQRFIIK